MWHDKVMYWSWIELPKEAKLRCDGRFVSAPPVPTIKKLDYITVNAGAPAEFKLCIGVWDDEKYTPLHRDELEFHAKRWPKISSNPKDMTVGVLNASALRVS